jgi:hypothetical protein
MLQQKCLPFLQSYFRLQLSLRSSLQQPLGLFHLELLEKLEQGSKALSSSTWFQPPLLPGLLQHLRFVRQISSYLSFSPHVCAVTLAQSPWHQILYAFN